MPAMPVVPGAWRVRFRWQTGNGIHRQSIVSFFRSTGGYQPATALAARLTARFHPDMLRGMALGMVFLGYRCFDLEQATETVQLPGNWLPVANYGGQVLYGPGVTIQARPAARVGPVSRFRTPFVRTAIIANSQVTKADAALITTAWTNFLVNMRADGWEWGRVERDSGAWVPFANVRCRVEMSMLQPRMNSVRVGPHT